MNEDILQVNNLTVEYLNETHSIIANRGVSLCVKQGEIIGLVGPNSCGKTTLLKAIMGLLLKQGKIIEGNVNFCGIDITEKSNEEDFINYHDFMSKIRGKDLCMIFQQTQSYFDNLMSVSDQLVESIRIHQKLKKRDCKKIALDILTDIGLPDTKKTMKKYPIQLNEGAMQQVAIAMALVNKPKLILADEPFSALDNISKEKAIDYIINYCHNNNASLILVSHDLELIKSICDKAYFINDGQILDSGNCPDIFENTTNTFFQDYIASKKD